MAQSSKKYYQLLDEIKSDGPVDWCAKRLIIDNYRYNSLKGVFTNLKALKSAVASGFIDNYDAPASKLYGELCKFKKYMPLNS